jgi:hypothetical protein
MWSIVINWGKNRKKNHLKLWWDDYECDDNDNDDNDDNDDDDGNINANTVFCFVFNFILFLFFWSLWWLGGKNRENSIKIIMTSTLPIKGRALMIVQYYVGSAKTLNQKT